MSNITDLLRINQTFKDLKLLATIAGNDKIINWGIFFSKNRGVERLWLLPVSETANTQAAKCASGNQVLLDLTCSGIVIRNDTGRKFWYDEEEQWEKDLALVLEKDTKLRRLDHGKWNNVNLSDGSIWNYWLTEPPLATSDAILVFPAPKCYIINENGAYDDYEIWFGVRDRQIPFIAIDKQYNYQGKDCPITWLANNGIGKRNEDLLVHKTGEAFGAANFIDDPLEQYRDGDNANGPRCAEFLKVFKNSTTDVNAWMIIDGKNGINFSVCYARQISFQRFSKLFAIIFQNCSDQQTQLFTKLYHLASLFEQSYELLKRTKVGINNVLDANPIGIVPQVGIQPDFDVPDTITCVNEWSIDNAAKCNVENSFSLVNSLFFKGRAILKDENISQPSVTINISNASTSGSQITIKKAGLQSNINNVEVNDNGTILRFLLASYEIDPQKIIDGAFEFDIGFNTIKPSNLPVRKYGEIKFTLQDKKTQQPFFLWQYPGRNKAENIVLQYAITDFSLPVKSVSAAGQDLLNSERYIAPGSLGAIVEGAGEREEAPLVIPIPTQGDPKEQKYFLTFSESVNLGQNYRLDIKLQETDPGSGTDNSSSIKAIVIDTFPQFIGLVDARFLQQPAYDDGAWILARRSQLSLESGAWEILDDGANTEGFRLILPAQAIGEAYTKKDLGDPDSAGEPKEHEPVAYKFGAPGIFKLANERLERRYVSPPWNLRHIWGQAGNELPGVPFLEGQFELLYGLTGYLKPEATSIAELGSRLGEVPVPPSNTVFWEPTPVQSEVFARAWQNYLRFYRVWKSRLAILETAKDNPAGNNKFTENLKYTPRIGFKAEPPAVPDNQPSGIFKRIGASLKYPVTAPPDAIPVDGKISAQDMEKLEKKIYAAHDLSGLAGGFHYGFESQAIYSEFWREAFKEGSSSAELIAPSFSAMGGWGKQTARFAGDKTVIRSSTSMGRANFYAVERIGRIAVLWHKAKHVIEYERTVVPPVYFKDQPPLLGRPIVRKVREYIEILEPNKKYPDFEGHSDDAPGSIKACHFKSIIIPVRSSWGKDVSFNINNDIQNFGWEIPLWNPDADPDLFPKPQVVFELIAPADANLESVVVNLSEPQNLRFYTDTREKVDLSETAPGVPLTADTTQWPSVKYVDYTDLPLPIENALAPALDPGSGEGMQQMMPEILDVSPGFARFTFRVDKSELPSGVANRYNPKSGISGKLKTVTMMRKPVNSKLSDNQAFALLAGNPGSLINQIYNGDLLKVSSVETISEKIAKAFEPNGQLAASVKPLLNADIGNLRHFQKVYKADGTVLMTPLNYIWKESVISAEGLLNRTISGYQEQSRVFNKEIDALVNQGGEAKQTALESLRRFKDRIAMFHLQADYGIEFIASIRGLLQNGLQTAVTKLEKEQQNITDFIVQETANLQELINSVLTDLQQYKDQATGILDSISQQLETLIKAIQSIKLPRIYLTEQKAAIKYLEDLKAQAETVKNEIQGYTEIEQLKRGLDGLKTNAVTFIDDCKTQLVTLIKAARDFVDQQFQTIQATLDAFKTEVAGLEKTITSQIDQKIKDIDDNWEAGKQVLISDVVELTDEVEKLIDGDPDSFKSFLARILYKDPIAMDSIFGILKNVESFLKSLFPEFKNSLFDNISDFDNIDDNVKEWLKGLEAYKELQEVLGNDPTPEKIAEKAMAFTNVLSAEFGGLTEQLAEKIKEVDQAGASFKDLQNSGKQVLDNYRSVWNEFTAPGMGLNRKTIAMIVNKDWDGDIQKRLSITPCIARVKQFENDLEGLGMRLPVTNVFEGLLPPKPEWVKDAGEYGQSLLNKFNFSDVLSDIGAMRLDKLFPDFKMPDNLRDNIKLTQGFDKQNLFAWANAEIDFNLNAPQSILAIGPIDVKLNSGRFVAKVRMEMDIEGKTRKQNTGMLAGNWEINISSVPIMTFRDAKAIFENEKLTFDLDPARMEMPGLLKLLTDASKNIPVSGTASPEGTSQSPFSIGLLEVSSEEISPVLAGRKLPIGVKASLDLPPVSVGGGPTSMTNLSFGGHFILQFWDIERKTFDFMTGLGFYLGKQEAPFNFTAFILGGGGFVNCNIIFKPQQGLAVSFVLSVHASVGFALTVGWMNGSILIALGLEGEYLKKPGAGASVFVSIFVQIVGTVDILGLVSVYLGLRLAATYTGTQLIGKGQVVLRIKICWCLTISVDKEYEKTFVGGGNTANANRESNDSKASKISNTLS